jgi:hypothetical protein
MCTLLLAWRLDDSWPLIAGNNRDEFLERAALPPRLYRFGAGGYYIAPRDRRAGGTWWAGNDSGMVVWLTNRWNGFGNDPEKRSRGAVVLELIACGSPAAARHRLMTIDPRDYNPFNVLVANRTTGFLYSNHPAPEFCPLEPGFVYLGNGPLEDNRSMKASMARRLFRELTAAGAESPADVDFPLAGVDGTALGPGGGNNRMLSRHDVFLKRVWCGFQRLLRTGLPQEWLPPRGINVRLAEYGTTSSTLLAISSHPVPRFCLWYAPGNPIEVSYVDYRALTFLLSGAGGTAT